jgi:hypothetical protein
MLGKGDCMKNKRHLKRRGRFGFTSADPKSGYALRFEQGKDGFWWGYATSISANGGGSTLGKARTDVASCIRFVLGYYAEIGKAIPKPEYEPR